MSTTGSDNERSDTIPMKILSVRQPIPEAEHKTHDSDDPPSITV